MAHATLQQQYLEIYLTINTAEHLEKQGDIRGALEDYKDCYKKLAKIHDSDPNWETALVVHRMDDCKAKIQALQPQVDSLGAPPPPSIVPGTTNPPQGVNPPGLPGPQPLGPTTVPGSNDADENKALHVELNAVKEELRLTKEKLQDSQAQLDTYRIQLQTVNKQLADLKSQQTPDDRMAKLLADNKSLTDKLATAQKEISEFKMNPKSKLAQAQAQLKNLQDQYDSTLAANQALQTTTTTLKGQLESAQNDLAAANQKLAAAPTASPEYETLKRENEVMRGILTRELQEQAHRDAAKRLAQEEFDNLKLKSKVLQEQLDILGSPMTPPTNDQERALLLSLKAPGPDVATPPTNGSGFAVTHADGGGTTAPTATASADTTTNNSPVTVVMNQPDTNTPAAAAPDPAPAPTQPAAAAPDPTTTVTTPPATTTPASTTPDPSTPAPPASPTPAASSPDVAVAPTAPPPPSPNKGVVTAPTEIQDQTISHQADPNAANDPSNYAHTPKLPDDMRDTAQEAADLFKNQKYDESAAKYQSIIDKYPGSLYAWSNLGVVRFQQGKLDEALKALQQAVKLSPTDSFSYSNLGIVYYQLGQYENAIDALNSAKALDPNDAKTHNYLGCAESQKGWSEVAAKEFRRAIDIDPNFGDAHFNLALVYATAKPPMIEMARREYNRALELGIAKDPRLEKLLNGQQ